MCKINVDLYGGKGMFGGCETPLEADIIYCDRHDECTFYKENKCLRCRSFFNPSCKFGGNSIIHGYTSRAKKYGDFKREYENDEMYNKLHYPSSLVAVMRDTLYMNLKYTNVRKRNESTDKRIKDIEGYIIGDSGFIANGNIFIPISDVTNTLLYAIFSNKPRTIMGGEITDYQEKVIPDIMQDLKKVAPEIYKKFISEYPQYDMEPNYVGKYAYIKTMVEGSELQDCQGNKYVLRNGKLYCDNMTYGFVPFNGASASVVVTPKDDAIYQITNNGQCNENTRFK